MTAIGLERRRPRIGADRGFYLVMAAIIAMVVLAGFVPSYAARIKATGLPPLVHIHGAAFLAWIGLFGVQSFLVQRRSLAMHRRLGALGAGLAALMVILGVAATVMSLKNHTVPPFFPLNVFLVLNIMDMTTFGGLVAAAVMLRRKPDWHKRLMLCATVVVMTPGLARMLPMGNFGIFAPWVLYLSILVFIGVGVINDLVTRRAVHPAYLWGAGAVTVMQVAIGPLAFSPPIQALTHAIAA